MILASEFLIKWNYDLKGKDRRCHPQTSGDGQIYFPHQKEPHSSQAQRARTRRPGSACNLPYSSVRRREQDACAQARISCFANRRDHKLPEEMPQRRSGEANAQTNWIVSPNEKEDECRDVGTVQRPCESPGGAGGEVVGETGGDGDNGENGREHNVHV